MNSLAHVRHAAILDNAKQLLTEVINSKGINDGGHGIDHAIIVLNHATEALKVRNKCSDGCACELNESQHLAVKLAALLHDSDDKKIFPNSFNNENAMNILQKLGQENLIPLVIEMIELVSCSKWGNSSPEGTPPWKLIPRYADRIEALGEIGIYRAYVYSHHTKRPLEKLFSQSTIPRNQDDLDICTITCKPRFEDYYKRGVKSESFLDHFYDKIIHLLTETHNDYLNSKLKESMFPIHQFLINMSNRAFANRFREMYSRPKLEFEDFKAELMLQSPRS